MPNARRYVDAHYASGGPTESDMEYYDANLTAGVDGDAGGSYAPTSPIIIAGSGLLVSGPLVMARSAQLLANSAPTIFCADGDWPELGPNNPLTTHLVQRELNTAKGIPTYHWQARADGGFQAFSPMLDLSDGQGMRVARAQGSLRFHDRSTISQIVINFRVGTPHTALPATMPMVRILRVDASGNIAPLTSQVAGADVNGYVAVPKPASPTLWYNNGASQSLTIPCDQNNVVDISQYSYLFELVEEQGLTGYPWALVYKQPVVCLLNAFSSAWFVSGGTPAGAALDGLTLATGDRVLVSEIGPGASALGPQQPALGAPLGLSGIWIVNSTGGWQRAPDWQVASDFTSGFVVPIMGGTVWGGLMGHADPSVTTWTLVAGSNASQGTPVTFLPRGSFVFGEAPRPGFAYAQGIIWDCATIFQAQIADMRPQ